MIVDELGAAPNVAVSSRRRRTQLVAVGLTVALLATLAVRWVTGAHVLYSYGNSIGAPGHIGHATYVEAGVNPVGGLGVTRTIDVQALTPVVRTNTAAASIGVLLCHFDAPLAVHIGVDDTTELCASVDVVHTGRLTLDNNMTEVILVITPNARGTVHIAGIDVTYRAGLRRGHQHVGIDTTIRVS